MRRRVISLHNSFSFTLFIDSQSRGCRFMDACEKGLNGKQAIWTSKKYRSYRVLPEGSFI
ncbi:hypothetical protein K503DRAFT_702820 [Rhizopogon vinicolor AM-OR11-026]|uniref:Uncharacterized protein n=1 Tax=Rhizopogon vinicolor AM-OR11-026 TaxID=1314800 RepID=A0A1B7MHB9_9AGAM|nr:hypothetical protein K503DRAFT_702820 [Rhizopogon vinicolor AM-OR11-026]